MIQVLWSAPAADRSQGQKFITAFMILQPVAYIRDDAETQHL